MLEEATTILKAKELMDLALVAADWAKRKKMGDEAIAYANRYALYAGRRMAELIDVEEKAGRLATRQTTLRRGPDVPSLHNGKIATTADIGITRKERAAVKKLLTIPEIEFSDAAEKNKTISKVIKEIRTKEIQSERNMLAERGKEISQDEKFVVKVANIESYLPGKEFDFIITDPPYGHEFVSLYETLAVRACKILKNSGLVIVMCGQSFLDQIYYKMSIHLDYYWTASYLTPGQPTPLRNRQVNTCWKPLLIFVKKNHQYKGKIFGDVFKSDGNDKSFHKWGQSESGMYDIISSICLPGQSIFDPFCGASTTGIAAYKHGCLFHGIDIDEKNILISRARFYDATKKR